jgi:error-prone DNA polymerase
MRAAGSFPLPRGRGDEAKHGGGLDRRDALGRTARRLPVPDLRPESGIKIRTRDFR